MPGITTPNMMLVLPKLGDDRGTWDDLLNAALTKIDTHDHTAGNGVQIGSAGLNINADLPFHGYGPTGLGKAAFSAVTALTTGARTLFVNTADGELYWRTNGGVNVQLTSGSSLNISLLGGIAGDYTAASAQVYYDEASKTYRFTSAGSPKVWARVEAGAFRVAKFGTSAAFYASIEVDAAIAANYTLTLPATVGAGLLQSTGAGALSFSYSLPNNQSLTLVGTAKINRGDSMLQLAHETLIFAGGGGTYSLSTADSLTGQSLGTFSVGGGYGYIDAHGLKPGDRVKSVIVAYTTLAAAPTIVGMRGTYNGGFAWSTTVGTPGTVGGVTFCTYTVDTPKAIGVFAPGGGIPATSERLRLKVLANTDTTVIYGITLIYDSIDTPTYNT